MTVSPPVEPTEDAGGITNENSFILHESDYYASGNIKPAEP